MGARRLGGKGRQRWRWRQWWWRQRRATAAEPPPPASPPPPHTHHHHYAHHRQPNSAAITTTATAATSAPAPSPPPRLRPSPPPTSPPPPPPPPCDDGLSGLLPSSCLWRSFVNPKPVLAWEIPGANWRRCAACAQLGRFPSMFSRLRRFSSLSAS